MTTTKGDKMISAHSRLAIMAAFAPTTTRISKPPKAPKGRDEIDELRQKAQEKRDRKNARRLKVTT